MADKRWKAVERRIARYIGGKRVPITGRQRGDAPDIEHNWLAPEVKTRNKLPAWIHDAMRQAVASKRKRQMPCVILHEKGMETGECLIIFKLRDARDHWL